MKTKEPVKKQTVTVKDLKTKKNPKGGSSTGTKTATTHLGRCRY